MRLSTRNQLNGTIAEVDLGSVMAIVMLCVDDDTYAGVRERALPAEPACGTVILRFVVVGAAGAAEAGLLACGTAWPPPPEHAVSPAVSRTGSQRLICLTFDEPRCDARSEHGPVAASTKYAA